MPVVTGYGSALKPAHEPIVLARKPLDGSTVDTVLKYGTGALNIAGARVGVEGGTRWTPPEDDRGDEGMHGGGIHDGEIAELDAGRWPPNVLFTHAGGCTPEACTTGCPVAELDAQSGTSSNGDEGGASRFFPQLAYDADDDAGTPIMLYCAKPSTAERNAGCEQLPAREVNDALEPGDPGYSNPRAGAGRGGAMPNFHPTVKPVALMRWLVRLVTPPGGVVLDPFAGSGSTLVAAVLEGVNAIGCERDADYLPIMAARVRWARQLAEPAPAEPVDA